MKLKYFASCETLEELKQTYKKLIFKYHPDSPNGNEEITKVINSEYDFLFPRLKNTFTNSKGEQYTKQNDESVNTYKDIINSIIHLHGIQIEIIGSWIWITGETKKYKETFKQLKFRWSKNKMAWYYHNEPYRKKSKNKYNMDDIRNLFGSEEVKTSPSPLIN